MKIAGLLPGSEVHHLDHLAPLCSLLEIPLIVTDEEIERLAILYYPDLKLSFIHSLEMPFKVLGDYECIITCLPRVLIDQLFFVAQSLLNKRLKTIWCPHGNSDKGWQSPFMEGLKEEELLLVYGERMRSFLRAKGIFLPTLSVGNYRLEYYERHRAFYDELLPDIEKNALLYAPTWQDSEHSSSLEGFYPHLMSCPDDFHLIVKPHPHLFKQFPHILGKLSPHLLDPFPPIYPLLNYTECYIGDMSSIGYDYLAFNRPMVLLNPHRKKPEDPGLYLAQCALLLSPENYSSLYSNIRLLFMNNPWKQKQKELYQETFDQCKVALHDFCSY